MQKLTQKYVLAYIINNFPNGYEYSAEDWPLHVTLADVFAIDGDPKDLINGLTKRLSSRQQVESKIVGEEWFGQDKGVHVSLLDRTEELQELHETLLKVLSNYDVKFNNPEYINEGFRPHSTIQKNERFEINDIVTLDSVTLIDMFPNEDPYRRKILSTIYF